MNRQKLILVTGATGTVGTHIVDQLIEAGHPVRALTRNPNHKDFPDGVEIAVGNLAEPETLVPAFKGVSGMHLIAFDGNHNYEPLQTGPELMELAKLAGIKRVTVLTGTNGELDLAKAVEDSGLEWTHVRPRVQFMANMLEWASAIKNEQPVRVSFPDVPDAMIDEADVASLLVASLLQDKHSSKIYAPTGPEVITRRKAIQQIAEEVGKDIRITELSKQQVREEMLASGVSEEVTDFVLTFHENPPREAYTVVPLIENIINRPPRKFKDWFKNHTELFS